MLEELVYFGRAEDYRKFVRDTASLKSAFRPGRLQSDVVQEFRGHHEVVDRLGRILAFIDHIQLVHYCPGDEFLIRANPRITRKLGRLLGFPDLNRFWPIRAETFVGGFAQRSSTMRDECWPNNFFPST